MPELLPALNGGASNAEMDRRRSAVRAAMADNGIDVLLMQTNQECLGQYGRYLTNVATSGGYPLTVIFPREDEVILVLHGPLGKEMVLPAWRPDFLQGVEKLVTTPSFISAAYTQLYDAEATDRVLQKYARANVGLVGPGSFPYPFMQHLLSNSLANAKVMDATWLVDDIRAIKSAEEIEQIRLTCASQDEIMNDLRHSIQPGMLERDVAVVALDKSRHAGSDQGVVLCGTAPVGYPTGHRMPFMQGNRIEAGNQVHVLVEYAGSAGLWAELGRTFVLGRASQEMQDELGFVKEARAETLRLLQPGAPCSEIWDRYNTFMRLHGRAEEDRVHCHGQGYDVVERPLARWDDPATIRENMVFAVHPTYKTETSYNWLCDNYLVTADGPVRLHNFAEDIIELT